MRNITQNDISSEHIFYSLPFKSNSDTDEMLLIKLIQLLNPTDFQYMMRGNDIKIDYRRNYIIIEYIYEGDNDYYPFTMYLELVRQVDDNGNEIKLLLYSRFSQHVHRLFDIIIREKLYDWETVIGLTRVSL